MFGYFLFSIYFDMTEDECELIESWADCNHLSLIHNPKLPHLNMFEVNAAINSQTVPFHHRFNILKTNWKNYRANLAAVITNIPNRLHEHYHQPWLHLQ